MKLLYNPTVMTFEMTVPDLMICEGIQKFGGFSRGWHHWNSIRLGANRSENEGVRLHLYCYVNGKQISKVIETYEVGEKLKVELEWRWSRLAAWIDNRRVAKIDNFHDTLPFGYTLGNYAEEDNTGKRLDFKVELRNVIIK